ncbi:hypothetical protein BSKO_01876 [Bryopsis sp. KO-2023]|nr:hypothetical protein BSKO_01876 [Bryopsis sp. KO-2023]
MSLPTTAWTGAPLSSQWTPSPLHAAPVLHSSRHFRLLAIDTRARRPAFDCRTRAAQRQEIQTNAAVAADAPVETSTECPRGPQWQVHKFGGTCMATPELITEAAKLVYDDSAEKKVMVVSAMGSHATSPVKVTDLILRMIEKASKQDVGFMLDLAALQEKHVTAAKGLLGDGPDLNQFLGTLLDDMSNLKAMLQAISIAGVVTDAFSEFVVGHGELWSAQLTAAACRKLGANAVFLDARDVLVVTPTADGTSVDVNYLTSNKNLDKWWSNNGSPDIIVATGFIARNPAGQATTLRRNGSDYSATIFGALFNSSKITIWTDVDGVFSADPRKVSEAFCLDDLSYHEAWELSYFGASVLHPRTTIPAMKDNVPITIRNFFNQEAPGTVIREEKEDSDGKSSVKGFATIDDVSIVSLEGTGMAGVPGIASRVFSAMRDSGINVIMISQASSEQSICFAVKGDDGEFAVRVLRSRFSDQIQDGTVSKVSKMDDCCVLAVVGQRMANRKGMAATMMSALAKSNVNIKAIAQGSSEYNITVVIDQKDSAKALRSVHSRFYLSQVVIAVGLVGPGLVGGTFLQQIKDQMKQLREDLNIELQVHGICSSKKMIFNSEGIDLDSNWQEDLEKGEDADLDKFSDGLSASYAANSVIVDATASDVPPSYYLSWIKKGIHIITPNKKLGSGSLQRYNDVRHTQRESFIHWFYEATVGAGLPVIATLKHLTETGDKIKKVEGIFSGTLSYIFNEFSEGQKFSDIVKKAKENGFTEPDPRDDLAGMDVARKVVILAREAGLMMELEDVPIQSLVPEPIKDTASVDEFMQRLPEFDSDMSKQMEEASAAGECLRFVGVVDCENGEGRVELRRFPKGHPFTQLTGSDNIISFTTERYFKQPLIVRGPGAGAEVTAGGIFSDLLRLAAYLGAAS